MVALYIPGLEEVVAQDVLTVWFAARVIGEVGQLTVSPEGLTLLVRLTLPEKLLMLVRVTGIEAPDAPELKLTGLTAKAKSATVTVTVAFRDSGSAIVPVTRTLNVPAVAPEQDKVDVADVPRVTLDGASVQLRPSGGFPTESTTVPFRPLIAVMVSVALPVALALMAIVAGLGLILKS